MNTSRHAQPPATAAGRPIKSEALFQGSSVLQVEHRGEIYTLRQTRNGKLILTK